MKRLLPLLILLFAWLSFTGLWQYNYEEIADIKNYPQDLMKYIEPDTANQRLISATEQSHLDMEYNTQYFAPWERRRAGHPKSDAVWAFNEFKNQTGYDETKKEWKNEWLDRIQANAGLGNYPNKQIRGITIRNTSLRMLPTKKPFFYNFDLDGEGFPFDNLQHSALSANTPVFVSHVSRDGAWSLVENHYGLGWIPTEDLAYVTQDFINLWRTGKYAALTKDNVSIRTENGLFLFQDSIGSFFPIVQERPDSFIIMAAVSNEGKMARALKAKISKQESTLKPLALTPYNLANIGNQLLGKPYGWGGLYGNRDCSSVAKDFFTPFGIYLPRNSSDQIKWGRSFLDISKYTGEDKKRIIIEKGVPFLTLLGIKGHMMVYIGTYNGQPMALHNPWGVRTSDWYDESGRHIVAKTSITTLEGGKELENYAPDGQWLKKTEKMTFLTDRTKP